MHLWPKTSEERLKTNEDGGRLARPIEKELKTTARKTTTSTEVKRRYNERVYCKVQAELPRDTVTAFKIKCREQGISQASILLEAIENFLRDG